MMWLGVDGGGTKTEFVLFDEGMRACERFRLGTCHPGQVGLGGMAAVLAEGLERARALSPEPLAGVGLGLAGFGQEADARAQMDAVAARVLEGMPYELVSDVEAAWAASLALADGIVVICGTGSIAFGRAGERSARAGGWGYQVGDEGSGYWLGREVLRLFSRQADGRDARGPLFDEVMRAFELAEPAGVISYARDVLAGDRTRTAALTGVLRAAAAAGDVTARDAYRRAACELADIVRAVARKLFDAPGAAPVPVSYIGGVIEGAGALVLGPLAEGLGAGFRVTAPVHEPAAGACLLLRRDLERDSAPREGFNRGGEASC